MSGTLESFAEIVRETLGDPQMVVTPETSAATVPGWDSVAMVDMIMAVEERFAIHLGSRDLDQIASVGDMVALIERKTGKPGE